MQTLAAPCPEPAPAVDQAAPEPALPERILDMLTASPRVAWPIADLASRFPAAGDEALLDALADLEARGDLATWMDRPEGAAVTLSHYTAWRLGLELDDHGRQWRRYSVRRRPFKVGRIVIALAAKQDLSDRCPPSKAMPLGFAGERPTVLLGERLVWHGPAWVALRPCRGCGGGPLDASEFCLLCEAGTAAERPRKRR